MGSSLRGNLVTAIGLVAAMTVVAGLVSGFFYTRIEGVLISVLDEQTPTIIESLRLAEASSRFAGGSLAFDAAQNQLQRQTVAVALNQQAHHLQEVLASLRHTGVDPHRLDLISGLVETLEHNLEQQNLAVEARLNLQTRVRRADAAREGAYQAFLEALRAAQPAGTDPASIARLWEIESTGSLMVHTYLKAKDMDRVEALQAARAAFEDRRRQLLDLVAMLRGGDGRAGGFPLVDQTVRTLIGQDEGPDQGFEILSTMIDVRERLHTLSAESGTIVSKLSISVGHLVDEVEVAANATGKRAGEEIAAGRLSMLAIAVATFLGPMVFVWLLVGRTIVVPLSNLATATRRIAAGELTAPIPTPRRGEIAALAEALVVFRDNTKALAERTAALATSEARLRSILEAAVFPILITRWERGEVVFANDQAATLFRAGCASALQGRDAAGFFEAPYQRWVLEDRLRGGDRVQNFETQLQTLDGRPFWALLSAVTMVYQDEPAILTSVNDISERKAIEEAQRQAKEEAERALEELKTTQERLVQSEKLAALGGLVAGVAHEINTPIGIVLTCASHLADETAKIQAQRLQGNIRRRDFDGYIAAATEGTAMMLANIRRAADLVQSFKNVSADQVSDVPRRFLLKPYLAEVLTSLSPSWRKAGHQVTLDCPEDIRIDGFPGVLSHILTNFITNSVTHGFEPTQCGQLSISARAPTPQTVELVYADNGRGIPLRDQSRVFEPFFTTRRGAGSSGLGLHIVYNLITGRLAGQIHLSSAEGRGVRFTLSFPRIAPTAEGIEAVGDG